MSQVSPYARQTAERSQHRKATTLFVTVAGAIFLAALWLTNPSLFFGASKSDESQKETLSNSPKEEPASEIQETGVRGRVDWAAQIDAIQQHLPDSGSADVTNVTLRLQAVHRILESERFPAEAVASIQRSLDKLRQQAEMLTAHSRLPNVDADGFAEEVTSAAQSIQPAEHELMREARDNAEHRIRQQKETDFRDVRLDLRDYQDKATSLRRQIAQMHREQSEFKAKAARAEALRRDMEDVDRYLKPFTAPGYLQPKVGSNAWTTERTVEKQPVSLSRLKKSGALEDTMKGLERLFIFGGGKNPALNNSRPLGAFPQYWAYRLNKPDVLEAVKRAQELLRDHGQALVEEQLLSP